MMASSPLSKCPGDGDLRTTIADGTSASSLRSVIAKTQQDTLDYRTSLVIELFLELGDRLARRLGEAAAPREDGERGLR